MNGSLPSEHAAGADVSPVMQYFRESKISNSSMLQLLIFCRHSEMTLTFKNHGNVLNSSDKLNIVCIQ